MLRIRPATDDDAQGVIDLIGRIFGEFEGCVLDLEGIDRELLAPASRLDRFWVMDLEGTVVGTGACSLEAEHVELKKMYIDPRHRGLGYGRKLVDLVEQTALQTGRRRIELWSDTRFVGAHGMYAHLGYQKTGATRQLDDPSHTTEFHFKKDL